METKLGLPDARRGKVRDIYPCTTTDGAAAMLLVATDRISAFDVVMPEGVPGKGEILTAISAFWFARVDEAFGRSIPHHLISTDIDRVEGLDAAERDALRGRVMVCRPAQTVPVECVVRGYLAGAGWASYRQSGMVCGVSLPAGLEKGQKLPEPIFTPTTKAAEGHDEPVTFDDACASVGADTMEWMRKRSLMLYELGHEHAAQRGLILADSKFEFGHALDGGGAVTGELMLIDELLTPDSSRYWPASRHTPGQEQPSFDKQFVRDHLQRLADDGGWDKSPPAPSLPNAVLAQTAAKYHEVLDRLRA